MMAEVYKIQSQTVWLEGREKYEKVKRKEPEEEEDLFDSYQLCTPQSYIRVYLDEFLSKLLPEQ